VPGVSFHNRGKSTLDTFGHHSQNQTLIDGRNTLELGESIWIIDSVAAALLDWSVILIAGFAGVMSMAAGMTARVH
jgi:hypothetical protein